MIEQSKIQNRKSKWNAARIKLFVRREALGGKSEAVGENFKFWIRKGGSDEASNFGS